MIFELSCSACLSTKIEAAAAADWKRVRVFIDFAACKSKMMQLICANTKVTSQLCHKMWKKRNEGENRNVASRMEVTMMKMLHHCVDERRRRWLDGWMDGDVEKFIRNSSLRSHKAKSWWHVVDIYANQRETFSSEMSIGHDITSPSGWCTKHHWILH